MIPPGVRAILDDLNARMSQMPRGLALFTKIFLVFAFLFPPLFLLVLLSYPLGNHTVKGVPVFTFGEFWQRMQPFKLVGGWIYSVVIVYGFTRATRWSRPLFLLPYLASPIWFVIHHATSTDVNYFSSLFSLAFFVWYLFFRQTVKDYYTRARESVSEHYEADF